MFEIVRNRLHKNVATQSQTAQHLSEAGCCGGLGNESYYIPNVAMLTHDRQRALFYSDLLRGKIVLVNFMSVKNEAQDSVSANLAKVQQLLGDRLGRDVFMYSIVDDLEHDTPQVLKQFAEKIGTKPGGKILTCSAEAPQLIKRRFNVQRNRDHQLGDQNDGEHQSSNQSIVNQDCSNRWVRYGNVDAGIWGSLAAKADPTLIVERVQWVTARQSIAGAPKRRGPPPLEESLASLAR